jgi:hypothetical protein
MKKAGRHYTYVLTDPRNNEVFYVGKGVSGRMHVHLQGRGDHGNPKLQNKISKILGLGLTPIGEKIFEHEDEWPCHANEMAAIAFYGRSSLCNLTNGGEGTSGRRWSEEAKAIISAAQSGEKGFWFGKKQSPESNALRAAALVGSKNHNFGKPIPFEVRDKIAGKLKGRPIPAVQRVKMMEAAIWKPKSLQHRANISAAKTGKKQPWLAGEKNPMFGKKHSAEIRDKISKALERARGDGKIFGRPRSLNPDQQKEVIRLLSEGTIQSQLARKFRVSRSTIARTVINRRRNVNETP